MVFVSLQPSLLKYSSLSPQQKKQALKRPEVQNSADLKKQVTEILGEISRRGDAALREFSKKFDHTEPQKAVLPSKEVAEKTLPPEFLSSFWAAHHTITKFHKLQVREDLQESYGQGEIHCERWVQGLEKVGFYVPGAAAPLFSSLMMMAIPAEIAGCSYRLLCTPPNPETRQIPPTMLAMASLLNINEVHGIGGAQAIAAMAYGTDQVTAVHKIFGPGNRWVNEAKLQVSQQGVAIDLPAGPSEVLLIADEEAPCEWVAADLIAQAEHGEDAHVVCVLLNEKLFPPILEALSRQLATLPRKEIAEKSLAHGVFIEASGLKEAMEVANTYAAEHLILQLKKPEEALVHLKHAGSVFLGYHSPETLGDYAAGTNHILPTSGYSKCYGGLSLESFQKTITLQSRNPFNTEQKLAQAAITLARAEGLEGHARAMELRLGSEVV